MVDKDKRLEHLDREDLNSVDTPKPSIHKYERYLPTAFDESLSLLEKVNKVIEFLNLVRDKANEVAVYVDDGFEVQINLLNEFIDDYNELKDYLLGDGLKDTAIEVLNKWYDDGTLAEIINNDVFDMKADKVDLENHIDSVTLAINNILEDFNDFKDEINDIIDTKLLPIEEQLNTEPYNIGLDVSTGEDITTYLQNKINELGNTRAIYVPRGTYTISGAIDLAEGTILMGDGDTSILHFIASGRLVLNYMVTVKQFMFTADNAYNGTVFYLDNSKIDEFIKERILVTITDIKARKTFNSQTTNKFMHLYGGGWDINPNINVGGFYGFTAKNIEVSGFNYPLHLEILDGWLHANTFENWHIHRFNYGIWLEGKRRNVNESDVRIKRNKFHMITMQPSQDITSKFIEQNKDFPNYWTGIDMWDITRWEKYTRVGDVHFDTLAGEDSQNSFTRYGVNLMPNGYYPFATTIDKRSPARLSLYYYESPANYADIHIMGDTVHVIGSRQYDDVLKFHLGSDGIYYVSTDGTTAFGSLYYKAMRNAGNLPRAKVENQAVINTLGLTPLNDIRYSNGNGQVVYRTNLMNGYTGQVSYVENGNSVTVTARLNTNNATAQIVTPISSPMIDVGSDYLRVGSDPWIAISSGGYLMVTPNTGVYSFTFSYVRD